MKSKFINLTQGNEIGANSYYMEFGGRGVVFDSGMHPKFDGYEALPALELVDRRKVDAIFVTHAHHDHIGSLPILMQRHPRAKVFMTEETYFMADPLLRNSVSIMKKQKRELGVDEYPLYSNPDITQCMERWQACRQNQPWSLNGYPISKSTKKEDLQFQFHHAGHILGAVAVEVMYKGRSVLYTGDINFGDQTIMTRAELPESGIDTLLIETTRGEQADANGYNRKQVIDDLLNGIRETFSRGGAVMIPVFAMGKTQELLMILHQAMKKRILPRSPIYIGGLSKVFTEVYDEFKAGGKISLMDDVKPEVLSGKKIAGLKPKKGHIYLISSGMMTENTLSNVFAQQILARKNDSIFFVGYADPESPAGRLRATKRGDRVTMNNTHGDQPVLCDVKYFDLTSHAIRSDILDYILTLNPRCCVLVHGDELALEWFKEELNEKAPKMSVVIPKPGKEMEI